MNRRDRIAALVFAALIIFGVSLMLGIVLATSNTIELNQAWACL